jgi:hypothetical protein
MKAIIAHLYVISKVLSGSSAVEVKRKETSFPFIVKFYSLRFGGFKKNIYFCKD